jgi:hypothetical protein
MSKVRLTANRPVFPFLPAAEHLSSVEFGMAR